jgi:hypothetical protein
VKSHSDADEIGERRPESGRHAYLLPDIGKKRLESRPR